MQISGDLRTGSLLKMCKCWCAGCDPAAEKLGQGHGLSWKAVTQLEITRRQWKMEGWGLRAEGWWVLLLLLDWVVGFMTFSIIAWALHAAALWILYFLVGFGTSGAANSPSPWHVQRVFEQIWPAWCLYFRTFSDLETFKIFLWWL